MPHRIGRWVRLYQARGEEGLKDLKTGPRPPRLPEPVRDKIIELKQEEPARGIKRISQLLRRMFFLKASPETVRQKLHEAQLIPPTQPPKQRNLTRPLFFERATPNQLWQSDIFTFRLGGRYAYLIAFLDDYSRYLVGADLFRSPTAQARTLWLRSKQQSTTSITNPAEHLMAAPPATCFTIITGAFACHRRPG